MIFPDWAAAAPKAESELPLYTEWAVDWEAETFAERGGKPYTVSGDEALRIWVYRALRPESCRFLYSAYSHDYGNQLATCLSGQMNRGILENLLRKEIRDTLLVSPYIREVDGFSFTRTPHGLTVRFAVHTVYEGFTTQTEVESL